MNEHASLLHWTKARLGRPILLNLRPIGNYRLDEHGTCSVCGARGKFAFNSWVIPVDQLATFSDPIVSAAYVRRESLFCRSCCSSLRVRNIADVLLSIYGGGLQSFAELVDEQDFRSLDIAEINTIGAVGSLHTFLARLPHLSFSEYHGADRLGEVIDGTRNEDLCRLTYADESFDLVLSSDTLEHVHDFRAALRETRRVLRSGGRHLFTVPVVATRDKSYARVAFDDEDNLVYLLPPLYHGRGRGLYRYIPESDDLLTFTEFGRDLTDHMREAGFEPEILHGADAKDETGAAFVFSGRVPD